MTLVGDGPPQTKGCPNVVQGRSNSCRNRDRDAPRGVQPQMPVAARVSYGTMPELAS